MTEHEDIILHGTAVAIRGKGVILTGKPGIGKSDLALRLIDRGAILISDDIMTLKKQGNKLQILAPDNIGGKIEVRHLGILEFPHVTAIDLYLKVELSHDPERFPLHKQVETICGMKISSIAIAPKEASAPIKIELALKQILESNVSK